MYSVCARTRRLSRDGRSSRPAKTSGLSFQDAVRFMGGESLQRTEPFEAMTCGVASMCTWFGITTNACRR